MADREVVEDAADDEKVELELDERELDRECAEMLERGESDRTGAWNSA